MESTDITDLATIAYKQLGFNTIESIEMAVARSVARSESYLKRRAARGTHTPTDDAILNDCALLALLLQIAKGEQTL
jgi:hypothetical protein